MENILKFTLVGDKFHTFVLGLFLKYNLNFRKIKSKVEIFPISSNMKYLSNDSNNMFQQKRNIIKNNAKNNQFLLLANLLDLQLNKDILFSNNKSKSFYIENEKLIDTNSFSNMYKFFKFQTLMTYYKNKTYECAEQDTSINEFLNKLKLNSDYKIFLQDYFYFSDNIDDFDNIDSRFLINIIKRKVEKYNVNISEKSKNYINKFKFSHMKINLTEEEFIKKLDISLNNFSVMQHKEISSKDDFNYIFDKFMNITEKENEYLLCLGNLESFLSNLPEEQKLKNDLNKLDSYLIKKQHKVSEILIEKNETENNSSGYLFLDKKNKVSEFHVDKLFPNIDNLKKVIITSPIDDLLHLNKYENQKVSENTYNENIFLPQKGFFNYYEKLTDAYSDKNILFLFSDIFSNNMNNLVLESELFSQFIMNQLI